MRNPVAEIVSEGVDCIVLAQAAWNPLGLKESIDHLSGVLRGNAQLSILVCNSEAPAWGEKQWNEFLLGYDLIQYHSGQLCSNSGAAQIWALTGVRRFYNPVSHARQLARECRPDLAIEILDRIPPGLIDSAELLVKLSLEKQKLYLQWQQQSGPNKPAQMPFSKERREHAQVKHSPCAPTAEEPGCRESLELSGVRRCDSASGPSRTTLNRVRPLHLGLVKGENYGWGVCSRYLIHEVGKLRPVAVLSPSDDAEENATLSGTLFQALVNVDFDPMFPRARAERNFGYTFFENELTKRSEENAKPFDKVLAGSTWCLERMREKGIKNSDLLIQGIDPEVFHPIDKPSDPERFVIFSGGKFELRKGQDLVLRAVKIMQAKYPDVWLVNCWYNLWPASTRLMTYSPHIRFEHHDGEPWAQIMQRTYAHNGLDSDRIVTCELMPQNLQRDLYFRTDIGLFPNRCEGGTNLVLMEYMACAKPVIASNTSGHQDILNENNALLLNRLAPFLVTDDRGESIAKWQEPSLDEIVAHLEYAYHHRKELVKYGRQAGLDLKKFTWAQSARRLIGIMEE